MRRKVHATILNNLLLSQIWIQFISNIHIKTQTEFLNMKVHRYIEICMLYVHFIVHKNLECCIIVSTAVTQLAANMVDFFFLMSCQ